MTKHVSSGRAISGAGMLDTLAVLGDVVLPMFGKGVIARRPNVVSLASRLGLDMRAVRRLQRLRDKYGSGLLMLHIPMRRKAIVLDPDDALRILDGSPEPFSPATPEKRSALSHFEPAVSLVSTGAERTERRRFNETVLDFGCPRHRFAGAFMTVVEDEVVRLVPRAGREISWSEFSGPWLRLVSRILLGDAAADDDALRKLLDDLRRRANWAFFATRQPQRIDELRSRIAGHLARAEPGSLAATIAATAQDATTAVEDQVAHWLFAFDPAGLATWRALALVAAHPDQQAALGREVGDGCGPDLADVPLARAAVLESLRLWPTTPAILRETSADTQWRGERLPAGTGLIIFAPFFHRDDDRLPFAHRFAPEIWLDGSRRGRWPLLPFSAGPAICPAKDFVPMIAGAFVAAIVRGRAIALEPPELVDPRRPMPDLLDPRAVRIRMGSRR